MSSNPIVPHAPLAGGGNGSVASDAGKSLFAYSAFNKLFFGSLFGKLADRLYQMALVATALAVFAGDDSAKQAARIQIVATIPLFFAYPLLGTLIDTTDRRRLMYLVMAIKSVIVLALIPLLWGVQSGMTGAVKKHWVVCLALAFMLSLVDAPFGPARAAAVPDVAPLEQRRLGASLMATSGLISLLLGTFLGGIAAQTEYLGPANTIFVAFGCYALSVILLQWLPAAVAVPGNARTHEETKNLKDAAAVAHESPEVKTNEAPDYFRKLYQGFVYGWKTLGIMELIAFETAFWCLGSAFYVLFFERLDVDMHLRANESLKVLSFVLGATGMGLFIGAISAGKLSRTVTPILTYPLAFIVMGLGATLIFSIPFEITTVSRPGENFLHGDWVNAVSPEVPHGRLARIFALEPIPAGAANVKIRWTPDGEPVSVAASVLSHSLGTVKAFALALLCGSGFILGLGGGLMLGRVDADVLSIADDRMRGRVFSIKATWFTLALIGTMQLLTDSTPVQRHLITEWLGAGVMLCAFPAAVLSWRVDIAIWADKGDTEVPSGLHAFGYTMARYIILLVFKIMFRYEVRGAGKVPQSGPVVLVANHASFIDPLFLGCCTPRNVQYIMHSYYYRSFAHPFFRFLRSIPVDEKNQLGAIKAGVRSLSQGACIGIFPEGHVTVDGQLQAPMSGALFIAQRGGAIVVPVALKGNYNAYPRHAWIPRFAKVTVIVGDPLPVPKDSSRKQVAELTDQIMGWLATNLELPPPPKSADKERERGKDKAGEPKGSEIQNAGSN